MVWPIFSKITGGLVKTATGVTKDVSGTAKDVTGIRRDLVETRLAERRLNREESPIQLANLQDVKEFDPKYEKIRSRARMYDLRRLMVGKPIRASHTFAGPFLIALTLLLIISAILWFVFKISVFKVPAYIATALLVTLLSLFVILMLTLLAFTGYEWVSDKLKQKSP
jgi:hypothetical protein